MIGQHFFLVNQFGYRIHYLSSFESNRRQNPDIQRQAYSKLIRVKPVCGVLQGPMLENFFCP